VFVWQCAGCFASQLHPASHDDLLFTHQHVSGIGYLGLFAVRGGGGMLNVFPVTCMSVLTGFPVPGHMLSMRQFQTVCTSNQYEWLFSRTVIRLCTKPITIT
jgi:hypothetical protein